jgi:hypothetical protein
MCAPTEGVSDSEKGESEVPGAFNEEEVIHVLFLYRIYILERKIF